MIGNNRKICRVISIGGATATGGLPREPTSIRHIPPAVSVSLINGWASNDATTMFVLVSTQVGRNFHSQGRGIEKKIFAWIEINVIPAEKKYFSLVDDLFMREIFPSQ